MCLSMYFHKGSSCLSVYLLLLRRDVSQASGTLADICARLPQCFGSVCEILCPAGRGALRVHEAFPPTEKWKLFFDGWAKLLI